MKPKKKFKGRETIKKVSEKMEKVGRLSRMVGVLVEKNRPLFEGKGSKDERGPTQIDVVICRGNSKLSFTAEEAEHIVGVLQEVLPAAKEAEKTCMEERAAWHGDRDTTRYEPGPGVGVLSPGKTQRTREKKAQKRKAE
jgi:hypothetical protein